MQIKTFDDVQQADIPVLLAGNELHVSLYLVDGLLIDTGPSQKRDIVISLLEQWEFEHVILTHHHEDHTGQAPWIQREKQVPIYIHEKGIELCQKRAKISLYRRLFWGRREPFDPLKLSNTFESAHYKWEVIYTPGHATDHIALYNRERGWMFGGDLYVQSRPKSMFRFEDVPTLISSLRKLLEYDFTTYFCQHAGVILDGKKAIKKKLDYFLQMQQKVLFMYNKGNSMKQIHRELFPKNNMMYYVSLGESSPKHFIDSVINVANSSSK